MSAGLISGKRKILRARALPEFNGLIEGDDTAHLESDHGSIFVNLDADSALTVQVHSTSGDVACMLPDMQSTTRTCTGELKSNGGELTIRTVSGAVIVQLTP